LGAEVRWCSYVAPSAVQENAESNISELPTKHAIAILISFESHTAPVN